MDHATLQEEEAALLFLNGQACQQSFRFLVFHNGSTCGPFRVAAGPNYIAAVKTHGKGGERPAAAAAAACRLGRRHANLPLQQVRSLNIIMTLLVRSSKKRTRTVSYCTALLHYRTTALPTVL